MRYASLDSAPPEGAIAYREYEVTMPDANTANIAFTLGDPIVDSLAADYAHRNGALAYGLVSVLDVPDAPKHAMIWTLMATHVCIASVDDGDEMSAGLRHVIARYLTFFFAEIAPIAPELAPLRFNLPSVANEK